MTNVQRAARRARPAAAALLAMLLVAVTACAVTTPRPTTSTAPSAPPAHQVLPATSPTSAGPTVPPSTAPAAIAVPNWTWTRHELSGVGSGPLTGALMVVKFGERFLAIGSRPRAREDERSILASDDGIHWTTLVKRPFDGAVGLRIGVVGDTVTATALRETTEEVTAAPTSAWRSRDGASWDLWIDVETDRSAPLVFANVAGRWVGVPADGPIRTSADGATWADTAAGIGAAMSTLVDGPAGLVVPGLVFGRGTRGQDVPRQSMWRSLDGRAWAEAPLEADAAVEAGPMAADEREYVVFGTAQPEDRPPALAGWWSADGTTWQRVSIPGAGEPTDQVTAVVAYQGGFVAIGTDEWTAGQLATSGRQLRWWSPDGKDWIRLEPGPEAWSGGTLMADGDRLLVFGNEGGPDGPAVLWEARPAGSS